MGFMGRGTRVEVNVGVTLGLINNGGTSRKIVENLNILLVVYFVFLSNKLRVRSNKGG